MFNKEVMFGTVIACSIDNTLTVQLDNGELGTVIAREVGRRYLSDNANLNYMVGRRYGYFASGTENGYRVLSARAYEQSLYEEIVRSFAAKERNIYTAQFVSKTRDGKLAFYALAQGVNASLSVADFATTRIPNFNEITLPRTLTVAIKELDQHGRIYLYGKVAFGDFQTSLEKLNLYRGSVVDGFVSGVTPKGDAVVSLAPNLSVLTRRAALGNWVKVQIAKVDREDHRVKGELLADCGEPFKERNFCTKFCVDAESYPPYVEISDFESNLTPVSSKKPLPASSTNTPNELELSYDLDNCEYSPFALKDGETAVQAPLSGGKPGHIIFEAQQGYLNERHMLVAKAINNLRYTSVFQLQRYLHLQHGLNVSAQQLWTIVNRLIKHDIIQSLRFSNEGKLSLQRILYPAAALFQTYTGEKKNLSNRFYITPDIAQIKCFLSSNQLLLGMLHSSRTITEVESKVFLTAADLKIRPRHKITTDTGDVVYLESARKTAVDDMIGKLQRYDSYFKNANEAASVAITLEDENTAREFAQRVAALRLSFKVLITSDLQCLPEPVFQEIPAYTLKKGGFFAKLIRRAKSA